MYIVAVMITAAVFSITGLGVLNLALLVNFDTDAAAVAIEEKIEAESAVNIALWKVNSGGDTLGSYTDGNVTSVFDSTELSLTVTYAGNEDTTGFKAFLKRDHHFNHAMASQNAILTYSYETGEEEEHRPRDNFEFLPIIDEGYWVAVADSIYTGSSRTYYDSDLIDGIMVFTGNDIQFYQINVSNATMVFTGGGEVYFSHSNTVVASYTDSTANPALVFTDTSATVFINEWYSSRKDHIEGGIFSNGNILIRRGELSGPIVARNIAVIRNIDLLDDQYPQYYTWNLGFGEFMSYDWPKNIIRWEEL